MVVMGLMLGGNAYNRFREETTKDSLKYKDVAIPFPGQVLKDRDAVAVLHENDFVFEILGQPNTVIVSREPGTGHQREIRGMLVDF